MNDKNHAGGLVPPGFANGHLCLSETCLYHYLMSYDGKYIEPHEQTHLFWDDKMQSINWSVGDPILAKRDTK